MRCAVRTCCNSTRKKNHPWRFYSFPRDEEVLQEWLMFCDRGDYFRHETARVCSAHFRPDDYVRNMQYEMGLCRQNAFRLKPGTVPTLEDVATHESMNQKSHRRYQRPTGPAAIAEVSPETCARRSITVKFEDEAEFIGVNDEPAAYIISANDFIETVEEEVTGIKIETETMMEYNETDATFEFVNTGNAPMLTSSTEFIQLTNTGNAPMLTSSNEFIQFASSSSSSSTQNSVEFAHPPSSPSPTDKQQLCEKIRALKAEAAELRHNKSLLEKTTKTHASEINVLKRRLVKAVYERDNMKEKLQQIFSPEQMNSLENGTQTQTWSKADIEQSLLLYAASGEAYKMLRAKSFPLPDVKTLKNWIIEKDVAID